MPLLNSFDYEHEHEHEQEHEQEHEHEQEQEHEHEQEHDLTTVFKSKIIITLHAHVLMRDSLS